MLEAAADALLFTMEQTLSLLVATQRRTQRRRRGLRLAEEGSQDLTVKMRVNKLAVLCKPSFPPNAPVPQRLPLLVLIPCSKAAERALLATSTAGVGSKPLVPGEYRLLVLCERSCGSCDYHFPEAHEGLLVDNPERLVRQFGAELEHTASLLESVALKVLTSVGFGAAGRNSSLVRSLGPPQKLHPSVLKGLGWMKSRSDDYLSAMPVRRMRKVCHARASMLGESNFSKTQNTLASLRALLKRNDDNQYKRLRKAGLSHTVARQRVAEMRQDKDSPATGSTIGAVRHHTIVTGGACWLCARCSHALSESGARVRYR